MEMLEKGIQPADYYRQELHELIHYDRHHQSELLRTLEIYLYENMNMKKAAASLYIHRHTLKYRLEKDRSANRIGAGQLSSAFTTSPSTNLLQIRPVTRIITVVNR